jgi:hypothetical protein
VKRTILGIAIVIAPLASVRAQYSDVSRFTPSVTIPDSGGKCERLPSAILHEGEQGYLLRFGIDRTAQRAASAIWDSTGHLRSYAEARGDLRGPPSKPVDRGERTIVSIDLRADRAILENTAHGESHGAIMVHAADALRAPNLGPPQAMLERLHRECGAPAP